MSGGQRTLTIKFVGDVKGLQRGLKDVVSGLDDTTSAGKRYAAAIDEMTGRAVAGAKQQRDAIEALSSALGTDTVAAIERSGGSVDEWVTKLNKAGLGLDELRADVDDVADAIRRAESANGTFDDLGVKSHAASRQIDVLRESSDQSQSVLANMVGNSVQDLGALGGVAGTAGMAIGQIAEYATEGSLGIQGLVKIAGPMVGVGVAVAGVSWAMGKLKESSEKAKAAAEGMLDVQKALRDGKFEDAATKLQEEWKGTISTLEDMGFTTEEVIGHLTGQSDITAELEKKVRATSKAFGDDYVAREKYQDGVEQLRTNLDLATTAFREQGDELDHTTTQTDAIETALRNLNGTATETGKVVDLSLINPFGRLIDRVEGVGSALEETTEEAIDPMQEALDDLGVQYDILKGKFDDRAAVDRANEALADLMLTMVDQESDWTDLRQASDDYALALADVVMAMDDIPVEVKSQFLAEIDEGNLNFVQGQLDALAHVRTAEFQLLISTVASDELKQMELRFNRDINGNGIIGRSAGGPVSPGNVYAVGDNPDGSWNATTELFVPGTSGSILSASDSRSALGGTVINLMVNVPPTADRGAIGREITEALLAYEQQTGPIWQRVRG